MGNTEHRKGSVRITVNTDHESTVRLTQQSAPETEKKIKQTMLPKPFRPEGLYCLRYAMTTRTKLLPVVARCLQMAGRRSWATESTSSLHSDAKNWPKADDTLVPDIY